MTERYLIEGFVLFKDITINAKMLLWKRTRVGASLSAPADISSRKLFDFDHWLDARS